MSKNFCIQSKYEKIFTRKTPYLDTFYTVEEHYNRCFHEKFWIFFKTVFLRIVAAESTVDIPEFQMPVGFSSFGKQHIVLQLILEVEEHKLRFLMTIETI